MCSKIIQCLIFLLPILPQTWNAPLSVIQNDHPPLTAEISSRLAAHAARLQEPQQDPRLVLPSAQDLETIRRIAEVLATLGQQVIPAVIRPSSCSGSSTTSTMTTDTEIPNDIVDID